jgi:hypothetical protein
MFNCDLVFLFIISIFVEIINYGINKNHNPINIDDIINIFVFSGEGK